MNNTMGYKGCVGSFNVRISPELHKAAVIAAMRDQTSLNSFVENAIANAVGAAR